MMTALIAARTARSRPTTLLAALAALVMLVAPAMTSAHSYKLGDIAVGHVWAPETDDVSGAAVYGPLLNRGDTPVRLLGASTPAAKAVRFRVTEDGETRWPETIELAPDKPLALAPWRVHIWLVGLKRPLEEGDAIDLTLDFGPAGILTVAVEVEPPGGGH